jgi:hypothetical protein
MPLPVKPLPTGSVTIEGTVVAIRALSRSEVVQLRKYEGNEDDAEPFVVACATGETEEEARRWLGSVSVETGGALLNEVLALTGLVDPQAGSTGEGPDDREPSEP